MIVNNTSNCPKCGAKLKYYDRVRRIVRTRGGEITRIYLRRFRCSECNSVHRELPDSIFPYKHYEADLIKTVQNGIDISSSLDCEDYPCDATVARWLKENTKIRIKNIVLYEKLNLKGE